MVVEVKGGRNVNIADVRALKGVLDNDEALLAGLIVLHPLGERKLRNFNQFMAGAGELGYRRSIISSDADIDSEGDT